MQEEVENKTFNLAISTGKLTARQTMSLGLKALEKIKEKAAETPTGKQSVKELVGQNQGVTNIDISRTDLKGFEKYARKFGVDYAVTKDRSVTPSKYLVFFKARDLDAMTAAFNAYSADLLSKDKAKPSVIRTLRDIAQKTITAPVKAITKNKIREQSR